MKILFLALISGILSLTVVSPAHAKVRDYCSYIPGVQTKADITYTGPYRRVHGTKNRCTTLYNPFNTPYMRYPKH